MSVGSSVKRRRGGIPTVEDNNPVRTTIYKASGQVPACLVNASVTYCNNDQIYAFGGFDQYTDEVYNIVLRLDLNTLEWQMIDNYGDIPGVRMGHTATYYQGTKLIVFGGENEHREHLSDVFVFDITTSVWTAPEIRGSPPRGRGRHAALIYDDKLFIVGGMAGEPDVPLDDLCYLDLKTWTWSPSWSIIARYDHSVWVWDDRLWLYGGIGLEMERNTDLWWLELKPFLAASISPYATSHQEPAFIARPYLGHLANLSRTHYIHRRRLKVPTTLSSVKFYGESSMPASLSGTHFHVYTSGSILDLVTPSEALRAPDCGISCLELDTLRWRKFAEGHDVFPPGYRWHYCATNEEGTKLWLLGSSLENTDENIVSEVLYLDLESYGMLGNKLSAQYQISQGALISSDREPYASIGQVMGIGADLLALFNQPPESGSGADFKITAEPDDFDDTLSIASSVSNSHDAIANLQSQPQSALSPKKSEPIYAHSIILLARWPHFKRLYSAKMSEYHEKAMHIPEPYSTVISFIYYLYTDNINPHLEYCNSVNEVGGMLIMANLYDMPKLRILCLNRLTRELDVSNAAIIFECASRTNEECLKRRAGSFCLENWGKVVRTEGFKNLARQYLMELCAAVDPDGKVLNGEQLSRRTNNVSRGASDESWDEEAEHDLML